MSQKYEFRTLIKQSLPQEHGSWAFVIEPLLISMIGGRIQSAISGLGFFLAFLAYRPATIALKDLLRKKLYSRTLPSAILGTILFLFGFGLMAISRSWLQIAILVGMGSVFILIDSKAEKRSLLREGFGALFAVPAACIAYPHWIPILVLRPIVTVLSVRGLIARWEDAQTCRRLSVALGILLIPIACLLSLRLDWRIAAYVICGGRTILAAKQGGEEVRPIKIGIAELVVSVTVVLCWFLNSLR